MALPSVTTWTSTAVTKSSGPIARVTLRSNAAATPARSGLRRRPARFRIRLDDQPTITRIGQGLLIVNLGRLQGGLAVVPDARPDDGVLDVAVLGTRTPLDWLRLATQVLLRRQRHGQIQQRQASPPGTAGPPWLPVELFRARRVEVDCDRPQPVERDGDPAGRC